MYRNKQIKSLALALLSFATAMPVYAELLHPDTDTYFITSEQDYEEFRQKVANGEPYANAYLLNDIKVNHPIGDGPEECHYRGTFDGQGYTITIDNMDDADPQNKVWGLFRYTEPGCVIKNLKVSGSMSSNNQYMGSIVGEAWDTKIENCFSDVTLTSTQLGEMHIGGLVGTAHGECFIENSAFIGTIDAPNSTHCYGLIGCVDEAMVNVKSSYVAGTFNVEGSNCYQFMEWRSESVHTFLNNYYCLKEGGKQLLPLQTATRFTMTEVKSGELCRRLNIDGRSGIVWYQNEDYPTPFRGSHGITVSLFDDGTYQYGGICEHNFDGETHICTRCGSIESGYNIEPLQIRSEVTNNEVYVGYLQYKLDATKETASVIGYYNKSGEVLAPVNTAGVMSVHIPESINVDGKEYEVTTISSSAFKGAYIHFCNIPKTITHVNNNAFDGCTALKYLHMADGSLQTIWLGESSNGEELFVSCPVEKVYIGRDLRWDSNSGHDAPFEGRAALTDVIFGPRITLIGNLRYVGDPNNGFNDELFVGSKNVKRVYIMGDEQSLSEPDIEVYNCKGTANATSYYINRNIKTSNYFTYSTGSYFEDGMLDNCESVAYGPFVKYITEKSFSAQAYDNNTTLKNVDLTNAIRLECVQAEAFMHCKTAQFGSLDFSVTNLKKIEDFAFTDCDQIEKVIIPASVTGVGKHAFYATCLTMLVIEDSDTPLTCGIKAFRHDPSSVPGRLMGTQVASVYQGRNIVMPDDEGIFGGWDKLGTLVIGPKVTELKDNTYEGFGAIGGLTFQPNPEGKPLKFASHFKNVFSYDVAISSMYINRELSCSQDHSGNGEFGWGSIRQSLINLTFGEQVKELYMTEFKNYTKLQTLVIPSSIKKIGTGAFNGCTALETVVISGDTEVGISAFSGCTSLKSLFLMGENSHLDMYAFLECKNIQEIYTAFETDSPLASDEQSFDSDVYKNASLISAGDTQNEKIQFKTLPWSKFENQSNPNATNDYEVDYSALSGNKFEHASMPHSFDADQFEMVYLPFAMDSYYFGADAEVYSLTQAGGKYDDVYSVAGAYKVDGVTFVAVDLDDVKTLNRGTYLVKTQRDESTMAAHRNIFDGPTQFITVDNTEQTLEGNDSQAVMAFGGKPTSLAAGKGAYVSDGGVLKLVNGQYDTMAGTVVLYDKVENGEQMVFNLQDDQNTVLLSSKADLSFNAMLDGYASFYDDAYNYLAPEWCNVYVVTTAADETITMEKIEDHVITAGQAVLLYTGTELPETGSLTEYLTYATHPSTATDLYDQNLLEGVSVATPVSELVSASYDYIYVLSCSNAGTNTGLYKYKSDKTLPAHKAYLSPDKLTSAQMAKSCLFVCEDAVNGIVRVEEEPVGIEGIYDIMGRRLKESGHQGIYIIDNKVVIK